MRSLTFGLACVVVGLVGSSLAAQEWSRFRGPNGTGVGEGKSIPAEWTADDYDWKTRLPGIGHSSPVLWGEKVFLLSADPKNATRYVVCVNAITGEILWTRDFPSESHHLHARSSYASCTPAADEDHVYVAWSTPKTTTFKAFTHGGKEAWSLDLGTWTSQHGFGASPVVYRDLVILHNSQQANQLKEGQIPGKSFMMAFDRQTGKERWRVPLVSKNVCYSVPFIYTDSQGRDQLVCICTGNGMFGLDPLTGKQIWALNEDDDPLFQMRTVGSPVTAGGLIFGSTGSGAYSGNYIVAVEPGSSPKLAYSLKNSGKFKAPYVPTMIAKGDALFLFYDRGFISCIDAPTGKVHWFERSGADFSGSPVLVGDKLYCIDEAGVVTVVAADTSGYKVLAKNDLGEPSRSTPAVANGRLYLRTYSHLISLGGK